MISLAYPLSICCTPLLHYTLSPCTPLLHYTLSICCTPLLHYTLSPCTSLLHETLSICCTLLLHFTLSPCTPLLHYTLSICCTPVLHYTLSPCTPLHITPKKIDWRGEAFTRHVPSHNIWLCRPAFWLMTPTHLADSSPSQQPGSAGLPHDSHPPLPTVERAAVFSHALHAPLAVSRWQPLVVSQSCCQAVHWEACWQPLVVSPQACRQAAEWEASASLVAMLCMSLRPSCACPWGQCWMGGLHQSGSNPVHVPGAILCMSLRPVLNGRLAPVW